MKARWRPYAVSLLSQVSKLEQRSKHKGADLDVGDEMPPNMCVASGSGMEQGKAARYVATLLSVIS